MADEAAKKGSWTVEEDRKLAEAIEIYGPRKWKTIATKAGVHRGAKSCRLRWMNYLRPNIKRGNISDQEEDLIIRLHKLLGNRWSLIAGRLPGRTDNEIKNYWNTHLSKKAKQRDIRLGGSMRQHCSTIKPQRQASLRNGDMKTSKEEETSKKYDQHLETKFDIDDFFDFSNENPSYLEWVKRFL